MKWYKTISNTLITIIVICAIVTLISAFTIDNEYTITVIQEPETINSEGKAIEIKFEPMIIEKQIISAHIQNVANKNPEFADKLSEIIIQESIDAGYDPYLTTSIITHESTFNPYCRGRAGEMGLMQVHPCHFRTYDRHKLNELRYNIWAGLSILKAHQNSAGSLNGGLRGYTGGRSGRYSKTWDRLKSKGEFYVHKS